VVFVLTEVPPWQPQEKAASVAPTVQAVQASAHRFNDLDLSIGKRSNLATTPVSVNLDVRQCSRVTGPVSGISAAHRTGFRGADARSGKMIFRTPGSPFAPALIQLAGVGVRYRGYRILFAIVLDKYHPEVLLGLFPSVPAEFLPPYYWSFSRVRFILSRANF
jgi:hypothetical protein